MDVTFFENQPYYSTIDIQGENRIQEYQFWEIETMTEPQTLESVIVHNSNPIPPAPSLPLQANEFIDTEPSTPLCLISSQIANNNEFIIYSRKKKKSQEDIEQWTHIGLIDETEPNLVPKETHSSNIDSNPNELEDDFFFFFFFR